jgi:ribosome-binding factor A
MRTTRGAGVSGRPSRPERVAEQLRQEISRLMVTEMKDPRVRMASISQVKLTADLRTARVLVSAIGTDEERRAVVDGLKHAAGYLRAELGHLLENLKVSPRLHFELDESIAYSVKVSTMLRELDSRRPRPTPGEEEPQS